jgi:hypothetical protein
MAKSWFHYLSVVIGFYLMIFFSFATFPYFIIKTQMNYRTLKKTVNIGTNANNTCKHHDKFRLDVPQSQFDIQIHEKLRNCFQPENDSLQLGVSLNFMWRHK